MVLGKTGDTSRSQDAVLRHTILVLTCVAAFLFRIHPVVRHEAMLHEHEPYFNYRVAKVLAEQGPYGLRNWFDILSWYPWGRTSSGVHWGLVGSAAATHRLLSLGGVASDLETVCVFLGPCLASGTVLAAYLLGKEVSGEHGAGLVAGALVAVLPGSASRSVAGAFQAEAVAVPAVLAASLLYLRSVDRGSVLWAAGAGAVLAALCWPWGGAAVVANVCAAHALLLLVLRRFSARVWAAYSTLCVAAAATGAAVHGVAEAEEVAWAELLGPVLLFGALQALAVASLLRAAAPAAWARLAAALSAPALFLLSLAALAAVCLLSLHLAASPSSLRLLSVLDPAFARAHAPLHASVADHQPATWATFFVDFHFALLLIPPGLLLAFRSGSSAAAFLVLFLFSSLLGGGLLVRGLPLLAPAAAVCAALALSAFLRAAAAQIKTGRGAGGKGGKGKEGKGGEAERREVALVLVGGVGVLLGLLVQHSAWATAAVHSAPGLILHATTSDGGRERLDDVREALGWLRENSPADAKVAGWWDHGFHIQALGGRAALVDHAALNASHVAAVALAFASPEPLAARVLKELGASYVVVVFGGLAGFEGDDLNKLVWMLRVAAARYDGTQEIGGERPVVEEARYLGGDGELRVDGEAGEALQESLLYRLSFHRFGGMVAELGKPPGFDRVRRAEIGLKELPLAHMDEVFTSEHWLVRIYKLRGLDNRR